MYEKFRVILVLCCLTFIIIPLASVYAINISDSIHIGGYLESQVGVRVNDGWDEKEKWDTSRWRNTVQLEYAWDVTDNFRASGIARGFYDATYSVNNYRFAGQDIDIDRFKSVPGGDNMREDFELREYKFMYSTGQLEICAGRQQIVWGESDFLRLADVINPLDMSWNWVLASWEDIRIPQRMINIKYTLDNQSFPLKLELVWNPEDFNPNVLAPPRANWAPKMVPDLSPMLDPFLINAPVGQLNFNNDFVWRNMKNQLPDKHDLENGQVGVRVGGTIGSWEVYLFDFYQRVQTAVVDIKDTSAEYMAGTAPYVVAPEFSWPYINNMGGTFNYYSGFLETVLRGEVAYVFNQPYAKKSVGPLASVLVPLALPDPGASYVKKDVVKVMLGFDRPSWIRFLNPDKTFFISGQLFGTFVLDTSDDKLYTGLGKDGREEDMYLFTLMANTEYWESRIKPEMVVGCDINGNNGFARAQLAYEPNFSWAFILGYVNLWGPDGSDSDKHHAGVFGPVCENDEVFFNVRLKF